jgi:hypothetical protein
MERVKQKLKIKRDVICYLEDISHHQHSKYLEYHFLYYLLKEKGLDELDTIRIIEYNDNFIAVLDVADKVILDGKKEDLFKKYRSMLKSWIKGV